eukprot:CAMPEP_0197640276 /NCGR_PEP_ID=MMETSP1338-20131121/14624_1 /TAXON_ID=43686 ORGANISM="Pelagodinium beii, Strain RCC1491" /NCGR_SAMPLE_ID=MMETSP1338 /ASSEMBLY_ACC=CAM_ASM_000754 /LENGTH=48 /DNA_ID= /DNA_START= /DNA_END= /DNA_ORIENTATION=
MGMGTPFSKKVLMAISSRLTWPCLPEAHQRMCPASRRGMPAKCTSSTG